MKHTEYLIYTRTYDGEMDVWGILEEQKAQCGFMNLLDINCVADVVKRGRLRWFGIWISGT